MEEGWRRPDLLHALQGPLRHIPESEYSFFLRFFFKKYGPRAFPCGSVGKESACDARLGFDPWVGKIPGEGNGNAFQENTMDRGAWRAIVHGVASVGHDLGTKPLPLLKSLLNLLQYCFCFTFWFFDHEAILAHGNLSSPTRD